MMNQFTGRVLALCVMALPALVMAKDFSAEAKVLVQKYPIVDGHIDVPYRLQEEWQDVTQATAGGDFDYPRARAGG